MKVCEHALRIITVLVVLKGATPQNPCSSSSCAYLTVANAGSVISPAQGLNWNLIIGYNSAPITSFPTQSVDSSYSAEASVVIPAGYSASLSLVFIHVCGGNVCGGYCAIGSTNFRGSGWYSPTGTVSLNYAGSETLTFLYGWALLVPPYGCVWQVVLTPCPLGYFCPNGTATPSSCPVGTFGNATALTSSLCSGNCSRGFFCPPGSTNATAVLCPCCPPSAQVAVSCSMTQSPSTSPSQTRSGTSSQTGTLTCSATPTRSASQTLTPSHSSSSSHTGTRSQHVTSSVSSSSTPTATLTKSLTRTPTETKSTGASDSETASSTISGSATGSESMSGSGTVSETHSQSSSGSGTPSMSTTLTRTPSSSTSSSVSGTMTVSLVPTQSSSASPSSSSSGTITASSLATQSSSLTQSSSPTPSSSASDTASSSQSKSLSPSVSLTLTRSSQATASGSVSLTTTLTPSLAQSPSTSPSQISTGSQTQSISSAISPSQSLTSTRTAASQTQSQLSTLAPGTSRSPTRTPTPSPSSIPYEIALVNGSFAALDALAGLELSDSQFAAYVGLVINRCPVQTSERRITLTCSLRDGLAIESRSIVDVAKYIPIVYSPAVATISCDASEPLTRVALPVSLSMLPDFRSPSLSAALNCSLVSSVNTNMGSASINVTVSATLWPTFDDVYIIASNGFARSIGGFGASNVTSLLLQNASSYTVNSLSSALKDMPTVLRTIQFTYGNVNISSEENAPFVLTLLGRTPLVLRSQSRAFSPHPRVVIGGIPCNDTTVSSDGRWLAVTTPGPETCSSGSSCSYAEISITNERSASEIGGSLSCPPFCSSSLWPRTSVIPVATRRDSTGESVKYVPSTVLPSGAVSTLDPSAYGSWYSPGIFFSTACSATGIFTDPTSGACTNASSPLFPLCAFGSGDACVSCPEGAMCPGGYRAWTLPGFFNALESSADVVKCSLPYATSKCVGWSSALSQTKCGPGYLQGSYLCGACMAGFYLSSDGSCAQCPASESVWDRYGTLILLFICLAGFACLTVAIMGTVVILAGGRIKDLIASVIGLVVYLLTVVQVLSNVSQVNSARLPILLQDVYRGITLLQLQGIVLPPSCTSGYYFSSDVALMTLGVVLWFAAAAISYARARGPSTLRHRSLYHAAHVCALLAVYLHPSISATALSLVSCQYVHLSNRAISALRVGTSLESAPLSSDGLTTVSVLSSNPYIECFAGVHAAAGIYACVVIAVYVIGLPLVTFIWLLRDPWLVEMLRHSIEHKTRGSRVSATHGLPRVSWSTPNGDSGVGSVINVDAVVSCSLDKRVAAKDSSPADDIAPDPVLRYFLKDSGYIVRAWYWRHLDMIILLGLAALAALLPLPASLPQLAIKIALTLALLCALLGLLTILPNPYAEPWKWYLRVALVSLSASCVVVNSASRALDLGHGGPALAEFIAPASYINIFVLCAAVATALLGFGRAQLLIALHDEGRSDENVVPENSAGSPCSPHKELSDANVSNHSAVTSSPPTVHMPLVEQEVHVNPSSWVAEFSADPASTLPNLERRTSINENRTSNVESSHRNTIGAELITYASSSVHLGTARRVRQSGVLTSPSQSGVRQSSPAYADFMDSISSEKQLDRTHDDLSHHLKQQSLPTGSIVKTPDIRHSHALPRFLISRQPEAVITESQLGAPVSPCRSIDASDRGRVGHTSARVESPSNVHISRVAPSASDAICVPNSIAGRAILPERRRSCAAFDAASLAALQNKRSVPLHPFSAFEDNMRGAGDERSYSRQLLPDPSIHGFGKRRKSAAMLFAGATAVSGGGGGFANHPLF